jgi:hypothetical protein
MLDSNVIIWLNVALIVLNAVIAIINFLLHQNQIAIMKRLGM